MKIRISLVVACCTVLVLMLVLKSTSVQAADANGVVCGQPASCTIKNIFAPVFGIWSTFNADVTVTGAEEAVTYYCNDRNLSSKFKCVTASTFIPIIYSNKRVDAFTSVVQIDIRPGTQGTQEMACRTILSSLTVCK